MPYFISLPTVLIGDAEQKKLSLLDQLCSYNRTTLFNVFSPLTHTAWVRWLYRKTLNSTRKLFMLGNIETSKFLTLLLEKFELNKQGDFILSDHDAESLQGKRKYLQTLQGVESVQKLTAEMQAKALIDLAWTGGIELDHHKLALLQRLAAGAKQHPLYLYGNFDNLQAFKLIQLLRDLLPHQIQHLPADKPDQNGFITLAPNIYLCVSCYMGTMTTSVKLSQLGLSTGKICLLAKLAEQIVDRTTIHLVSQREDEFTEAARLKLSYQQCYYPEQLLAVDISTSPIPVAYHV